MAKLLDQEPTVTKDTRGGTRANHPAYALIHASRVQGNRTLVGTDFMHHSYITLSISRAELNRELSRDWMFPRTELLEVCLSEAQWAAFVSSLNVGNGVSCTLNHLDGQMVPGIPHRTQTTEFKSEVTETIKDAIARLDVVINSSIPKKHADELRLVRQELVLNLPFVEDSFTKHVENTLEHAKTEVNAYVQAVVMRAGLAALTSTEDAPIELIDAPIEVLKGVQQR